jgi:hypothetical protein
MRLANVTFTCRFVPQNKGSDQALEQNWCLQADNSTIESITRHDNAQWLDDVTSGRIVQLTISAPGSQVKPKAFLWVDDTEGNRLIGGKHESLKAEEYYLQRVSLTAVGPWKVLGMKSTMRFAVHYMKAR